MGTRSLTVMQTSWEDHKEIAVLYRQFDGYPSGHGAELKEFLSGFKITNGLSLAGSPAKTANGGDCLAAQLVAHFKGNVPGHFYLYPAGTRDVGEEYIYTVIPTVGEEVRLKAEGVYPKSTIYDGPVSGFDTEIDE